MIIKKLFGCLFTLLFLVLLASIGIFFLLKSQFANIAEIYIGRVTGFPVHIEKLQANVIKGLLDTRNITIQNPDSFSEKNFLHINQLKIDLQVQGLLPKITGQELIIDIEELAYVKKIQDLSNIALFNENLGIFSIPEKELSTKKTNPLLFKRAILRIHKLKIIDLSRKKSVKEINLNFEKKFEQTDITPVFNHIKKEVLKHGIPCPPFLSVDPTNQF
jgi:hypothetical protein